MADTTTPTHPDAGGNGGLYVIIGAIVIAVMLIIAILSGVINITEPSVGGRDSGRLDLGVAMPKTPAPAPGK